MKTRLSALVFVALSFVSSVHAQNFAFTGSMNLPRSGHTATRLADGRVLVTGGDTGPGAAPTATAEI